jgi:hypothetical protein
MTIFTFANNINSTLASPVSSSATTIALASTANLPTSIPAGTVLVITLNDVATKQNFEVLYATARTGATLTVERAQEGTAALSWLTGDFAYSPPTAGQQAGFGQLGANNTWGANNTFSASVTVDGSVTADLGFVVPNNIAYTLNSTSGPFPAFFCNSANQVEIGNSALPFFINGASGGNVFGIGQTQQTVTRSYNTTYTNSTNAPIIASVATSATGIGGSIGGFINSAEFTNSTAYTSGVALCAWMIVPPGATYGWFTTGSVSGTATFTEIR